MLEEAQSVRGCCGFWTVISKYGEGFILPAEIAEKAGLSEGTVLPHVFLDNRGKNFVLNEMHLHVIPHPWNKKKAKAD